MLRLLSLLCLAFAAFSQNIVMERGQRNGWHVFADPAPAGQSFARWEGNTRLLADPQVWHTTLLDTGVNAQLRAVYEPLPTLSTGTGQVNGANYRYAIPRNYKAVVFRFHGSGGSAENLFTAVENEVFGRTLLLRQYAVLALDSANRQTRQWNSQYSPDNPDVRNVRAVLDELVRNGLLKTSDALFASGVSNGGGFTSRVTALLDWRGANYIISSGIDNIVRQSRVPSIWSISAGDETVGPDGNRQAWQNYRTLVAMGVRPPLRRIRRPRFTRGGASESRQ